MNHTSSNPAHAGTDLSNFGPARSCLTIAASSLRIGAIGERIANPALANVLGEIAASCDRLSTSLASPALSPTPAPQAADPEPSLDELLEALRGFAAIDADSRALIAEMHALKQRIEEHGKTSLARTVHLRETLARLFPGQSQSQSSLAGINR